MKTILVILSLTAGMVSADNSTSNRDRRCSIASNRCENRVVYSSCNNGNVSGRCVPFSGPNSFGKYDCRCQR